jgi:hypothetical protein
LLALLLPGVALAQTGGCGGSSTVGDYDRAMAAPASDFLAGLQRAVTANDRDAVAALVHYPLRVNGVKGVRWVSSRRDFERHYPAILTPRVRAAIARQRGVCLFANWQGVMIGDGEVWFSREAGGMRIITVNVK